MKAILSVYHCHSCTVLYYFMYIMYTSICQAGFSPGFQSAQLAKGTIIIFKKNTICITIMHGSHLGPFVTYLCVCSCYE
jgi:hypothetical protein